MIIYLWKPDWKLNLILSSSYDIKNVLHSFISEGHFHESGAIRIALKKKEVFVSYGNFKSSLVEISACFFWSLGIF